MRKIGHNSQRENATINGIHDYQQCFATSAWMLLSYYAPDKYKATDDTALKWYVDDVTKSNPDNEYEWEAQAVMIQKYLDAAGVKGKVKLGINLDTGIGTVSKDELLNLLATRPIIIGTKKMGGLPDGHIILGVDNCPNQDGKIVCNDPNGDARTFYQSDRGESVIYTVDMFDAQYPDGPVRCMWVEV